jgi:ElaB/YqjD/DUF883 family membrane-anchored ribosome-binding protein
LEKDAAQPATNPLVCDKSPVFDNPPAEDSDMATNGSDLPTTEPKDLGRKETALRENGLQENIASNPHAGTEAAARMAHEFVDRVALLAEQSEERIRNAALNAEETLRESLTTARTKGVAARESVGDLVQRHPWAAVGIAFGVGVLIATLARRDQVD